MTVYPRWRGEHSITSIKLLKKHRFIPAGAGNTIQSLGYSTFTTVYPRWRGEHAIPRIAIPILCGLSPLARGTLERKIKREGGVRFIPAGAGNTRERGNALIFTAVYPRWRGEHLHPLDGDE